MSTLSRRLILILVSAVLLVSAGAAWFFHAEHSSFLQEAELRLEAVARLKAERIAAWRAERFGDAAVLAESPFLAEKVGRWFASPQPETTKQMLARFRPLHTYYGYSDVLLIDTAGQVRLSLSGRLGPLEEHIREAVASSLRQRRPVFVDLQLCGDDASPRLGVAAPIFAPSGGSSYPAGVILLQIEASRDLYPQLASWPAPSETAETLLVRRDGGDVLFLNDLRHEKNTALRKRISLSEAELPAVMAAMGKEGLVRGKDYRGVDVLAILKQVPDSPWFLIAKIDATEAFATWRLESLLFLGFFLGLAAATACAVGFIWQCSAKAHFRSLLLAQESASDSRSKLSTVVAAAHDAIIMADAQGRISLWNDAAQRIFGFLAVEALGKDFQALLVPARFRDEYLRRFVGFRQSGDVVSRVIELVATHKSGREFPVELSLSSVTQQGGWQALSTIRDVTERKAAQEALRSREAELRRYAAALESSNQSLREVNRLAESATRAKSEFLANMSHEIRTPMTAILGYADLLADRFDDEDSQDAVDTIRRNGNHLLTLINDILDLSKIESGKFQTERIACSPASVLGEVVSLMRVRAAAKNLSLSLEFDGPCSETIQTDPTRLRQILVNLVGNALKFTQEGGVRIVVRLLDANSAAPKLSYDVQDTGIGISDRQVRELFQPFYQADASTSRLFGGTGLGLAISQRLAHLLGGGICASSRLGEGSSFNLTIDTGPLLGVALQAGPTQPATPRAKSDVAPRRTIRLNCRVLLAEDGLDNQRLISLLLRHAGAKLTVVDNGVKALDCGLATLAERTGGGGESPAPFDVILMDMQMPEMDGYEATRQLRAAGYALPILALTAHAMADDRQKCLDAGCDDYVTKPIDAQRLLAVVSEWANKEEAVTAGSPEVAN